MPIERGQSNVEVIIIPGGKLEVDRAAMKLTVINSGISNTVGPFDDTDDLNQAIEMARQAAISKHR